MVILYNQTLDLFRDDLVQSELHGINLIVILKYNQT